MLRWRNKKKLLVNSSDHEQDCITEVSLEFIHILQVIRIAYFLSVLFLKVVLKLYWAVTSPFLPRQLFCPPNYVQVNDKFEWL